MGANRRAPDRARASPVRLALRHGLRITGYRRNLLVRFQRSVEGIFRGFARNLRPRGRSGFRAYHPARARQCGMAQRRGPEDTPTASASFTCRPTAQNCSPPKPYGPSSTSQSSTSTLQPSRNSTQKSPNNASSWPNSQSKSKLGPDSIGGQSQSIRINYPETV